MLVNLQDLIPSPYLLEMRPKTQFGKDCKSILKMFNSMVFEKLDGGHLIVDGYRWVHIDETRQERYFKGFNEERLDFILNELCSQGYMASRGIISEGQGYTLYTSRDSEIIQDKKKHKYIYLIRAVGTNYYKIGVTKSPKDRLRVLSTSSPHDVEYYALSPANDSYTKEGYIHEFFKDYRIRGEWFRFKPAEARIARDLILSA